MRRRSSDKQAQERLQLVTPLDDLTDTRKILRVSSLSANSLSADMPIRPTTSSP
jgi:hypothetical protein